MLFKRIENWIVIFVFYKKLCNLKFFSLNAENNKIEFSVSPLFFIHFIFLIY